MAIAARFKSDVWLRSLSDAVLATRKAFGDEGRQSSPGGVAVLPPTAVCDDASDLDFKDWPSGLAFQLRQRHMDFSNIPDLVSRAGFPVCHNALDELWIAEWGLHDCLTLIELSSC